MELETSTLMMIFFILFLIMSIWKIYAFLPNKQLADDDTTEASQEELLKMIVSVIKRSDENITTKELLHMIKEDKNFDTKHFWRFNENRLLQILQAYYREYPETSTIKCIHQKVNS